VLARIGRSERSFGDQKGFAITRIWAASASRACRKRCAGCAFLDAPLMFLLHSHQSDLDSAIAGLIAADPRCASLCEGGTPSAAVAGLD